MTFAIDKINSNTLYISGASAGEFFRRSTDRGNTWQNLSGPNVSIVFLDFFIVNRIYLFNHSDKIYSDDGGVSWQNMAGDYTPNAHFISGYQDSKTSIIYAWFNEGLFYSENDNIYWRLIPGSQNLPVIQPSIYARTMKNISTDNNFIYIGTANGIYKTDYATGIDDISNNTLPAEYYLSQNYPNPFNPATTISYQIPEKSFVSFKVYDILGNKIITLVNEEKLPGEYQIVFEGSELPSGVYFYIFTAKSEISGYYTVGKKMILMK